MDLTFLPLNILSVETMWVSLGLSFLSYEMSFYSPQTTWHIKLRVCEDSFFLFLKYEMAESLLSQWMSSAD